MKKSISYSFLMIFIGLFFSFGKEMVGGTDSLTSKKNQENIFPRFALGSLNKDEPSLESQMESVYYYQSDHLGSVSYVTDHLGEVIQNIEYTAFGEVFLDEKNGEYDSPYLFNAKEEDEETGLYYYGARYYNPQTALWISVDPKSKKFPDYSPYNYTLNNPLRYTDPDGREPKETPKAPKESSTSEYLRRMTKWYMDHESIQITYGSTKHPTPQYEGYDVHEIYRGNEPTMVKNFNWTPEEGRHLSVLYLTKKNEATLLDNTAIKLNRAIIKNTLWVIASKDGPREDPPANPTLSEQARSIGVEIGYNSLSTIATGVKTLSFLRRAVIAGYNSEMVQRLTDASVDVLDRIQPTPSPPPPPLSSFEIKKPSIIKYYYYMTLKKINKIKRRFDR